MRFSIFIPRTPYGLVASILAGLTIAAVLWFVAFGAPSFNAAPGTDAYSRDETKFAITMIATLAGGSWIGTRLERWHLGREIRTHSAEALAKASGGQAPFGPNTSEVRAYIEWIATGPDFEVRSFAVTDTEDDRQRWRWEIERVTLDIARRGDLAVMPLFEKAAREAVDLALRQRYRDEPIASRGALHAAAVDLLFQPYVDGARFRARMRQYTKMAAPAPTTPALPPQAAAAAPLAQRLMELQEARLAGLVTDSEYEQMRAKIIAAG